MAQPDGPQVLVWTEGVYRCELWKVDGTSRLRVLAGSVLVYEEPCPQPHGGGYSRAVELRQRFRSGIVPSSDVADIGNE
jgi:hypothetical protein